MFFFGSSKILDRNFWSQKKFNFDEVYTFLVHSTYFGVVHSPTDSLLVLVSNLIAFSDLKWTSNYQGLVSWCIEKKQPTYIRKNVENVHLRRCLTCGSLNWRKIIKVRQFSPKMIGNQNPKAFANQHEIWIWHWKSAQNDQIKKLY